MLQDDLAVQGGALTELFADATRSAELVDWAAEWAGEAATVLLAAQLSRGEEKGQAAFVMAIVQLIRSGKATEHAARDWLLWLWADAPQSIRSRLSDESDLRAAEEVIVMHRSAAAGVAIEASEWRVARRKFRERLSTDAPACATETVVASMWDLSATPAAMADVASTWVNETSLVDSLRPTGWTWAEYAEVQSNWDAFSIAYSSIPRLAGEDDATFQARKTQYMQDHPPAISEEGYAKWKAMNGHRAEIQSLRVAELRQGLLDLLSI